MSVWVVDEAHARVHQGAMWHCSSLVTALSDGASLDMVITAPTNDNPHMMMEAACGGDAELLFYEGVLFSGGTTETVYNHKRTASDVWAGIVLTSPTITSTGTQLSVKFMPGGSHGQAQGSAQSFDQEWIIRNDSSYLLRLTNRSGSAKRASLGCSHYSSPLVILG